MKIDNLNVEIPRNADILKIVKTNDRASDEESTTYSLLTYGTDINSKRAQTIMTTTDIDTNRSVLDTNFYGSDNPEKSLEKLIIDKIRNIPVLREFDLSRNENSYAFGLKIGHTELLKKMLIEKDTSFYIVSGSLEVVADLEALLETDPSLRTQYGIEGIIYSKYLNSNEAYMVYNKEFIPSSVEIFTKEELSLDIEHFDIHTFGQTIKFISRD